MKKQNVAALFTLLRISLSMLVLNHKHSYALQQDDTQSKSRGRKCGFRGPTKAQLEKNEQDLTMYKNAIGKDHLDGLIDSTIIVDVYFHVITSTSDHGQVTNDQVLKQMEILNNAFEGIESSYGECANSGFTYGDTQRTPFHFNLVNLVRIESNGAFNLDDSASRELQAELRKGSCADLNVFTGEYEDLGEAHLPQFCPENGVNINTPDRSDNVLISYKTLPDAEPSDFTNIYDQGDTLVHEVGHFLGLDHTFAGGCDGIGDLVEDTPKEQRPAFGCPLGRDTCLGGGPDPIHNYMNYVDDCCMYRFTAGQNERMILQAGLYRGLQKDISDTDDSANEIDDGIDDGDGDDWISATDDDKVDFVTPQDEEIDSTDNFDDFDDFDDFFYIECGKKKIFDSVKTSLRNSILGEKNDLN